MLHCTTYCVSLDAAKKWTVMYKLQKSWRKIHLLWASLFSMICLKFKKIFSWWILSHTQMHTDLFLCQTEALVCDCLSADACTHWLCTEKPSGRPKPTHQLKFRCTSGWPQKQTFPRTWHSLMKFTKTIKTKSTVLNN